MHHEHQKFFRCLGMFCDKVGVNFEKRLYFAFDGSGWNLAGFDNIQKTQECGEGIGAAREALHYLVFDAFLIFYGR